MTAESQGRSGCVRADGARALRILIVEDDVDGALSTAMLLRFNGYEPQVAFDGPSALREVEGEQADVVLLDIELPGMDGYEVARRMRARAGGKNPFFIAITGYGREEDRQRSEEAGIDLHLLKPANPEELLALLVRLENIVLPPAG
jgi:CheY-like chemotaxis protein